MCNQPNPRVGLEKKEASIYTDMCIGSDRTSIRAVCVAERENVFFTNTTHQQSRTDSARADNPVGIVGGGRAVNSVPSSTTLLPATTTPALGKLVSVWLSRNGERERRGIMAEVDWLRAKVRELSIYGGKILFLFFYHQRESTE